MELQPQQPAPALRARLLERAPLGPARVVTRARWHLVQGYTLQCKPEDLAALSARGAGAVVVRDGAMDGRHKCLARNTRSERLPLATDCGEVLDPADAGLPTQDVDFPDTASDGGGGGDGEPRRAAMPAGAGAAAAAAFFATSTRGRAAASSAKTRRSSQPNMTRPPSSLFERHMSSIVGGGDGGVGEGGEGRAAGVAAGGGMRRPFTAGASRGRATSMPAEWEFPGGETAGLGGPLEGTHAAAVGGGDRGSWPPSLFDFDPNSSLRASLGDADGAAEGAAGAAGSGGSPRARGGIAATSPNTGAGAASAAAAASAWARHRPRTVVKGAGDAATTPQPLSSTPRRPVQRRGSLLDHLSPSLRFASILLASQVKKSTAKSVKDRFLGGVDGVRTAVPAVHAFQASLERGRLAREAQQQLQTQDQTHVQAQWQQQPPQQQHDAFSGGTDGSGVSGGVWGGGGRGPGGEGRGTAVAAARAGATKPQAASQLFAAARPTLLSLAMGGQGSATDSSYADSAAAAAASSSDGDGDGSAAADTDAKDTAAAASAPLSVDERFQQIRREQQAKAAARAVAGAEAAAAAAAAATSATAVAAETSGATQSGDNGDGANNAAPWRDGLPSGAAAAAGQAAQPTVAGSGGGGIEPGDGGGHAATTMTASSSSEVSLDMDSMDAMPAVLVPLGDEGEDSFVRGGPRRMTWATPAEQLTVDHAAPADPDEDGGGDDDNDGDEDDEDGDGDEDE